MFLKYSSLPSPYPTAPRDQCPLTWRRGRWFGELDVPPRSRPLPGPAVRKQQTPPVRMESRQVSTCASLLQGGCGASGRPPGHHGELQSYEEVAVGPVWTLCAPPAPPPCSPPPLPRATAQVQQALAGGGGARRVTMRKQPVCRGPLAGTGCAAETMAAQSAWRGGRGVCTRSQGCWGCVRRPDRSTFHLRGGPGAD